MVLGFLQSCQPRSGRSFLIGVMLGMSLAALAAGVFGVPASARSQEPAQSDQNDSAELAKLYEDDQADRKMDPAKPIDPAVMIARDRKRQARVKALHEAGVIHTGKDYRRAAMVLQHGETPEEYLLAHEFCLVALSKGERDARWLAAATEDRFLMNIGRPQRFGTQYRSTRPDEPVRLYAVGPGVTDGLRRELGVPSLEEARRREAAMNAIFHVKPREEAKR
jgi:hypothetical protein